MSYIYIFREGKKNKKNYFKIGESSCPSKRLIGCQIGNPRKLYNIKTIKSAYSKKLEFFLFNSLNQSHKRGEWFYDNQSVLLNKINKLFLEFNNLKLTNIQKFKCKGAFNIKGNSLELALKNSSAKRNKLKEDWANKVDFQSNIQYAMQTLDNPTTRSVAKFLNEMGIFSRRGLPWSCGSLYKQMYRLNLNWNEMKKNK